MNYSLVIIGKFLLWIMEDLYIYSNYLFVMNKMPVPWRQVYSYYCICVMYHLNCSHH